jgi:hypothetical protein
MILVDLMIYRLWFINIVRNYTNSVPKFNDRYNTLPRYFSLFSTHLWRTAPLVYLHKFVGRQQKSNILYCVEISSLKSEHPSKQVIKKQEHTRWTKILLENGEPLNKSDRKRNENLTIIPPGLLICNIKWRMITKSN